MKLCIPSLKHPLCSSPTPSRPSPPSSSPSLRHPLPFPCSPPLPFLLPLSLLSLLVSVPLSPLAFTSLPPSRSFFSPSCSHSSTPLFTSLTPVPLTLWRPPRRSHLALSTPSVLPSHPHRSGLLSHPPPFNFSQPSRFSLLLTPSCYLSPPPVHPSQPSVDLSPPPSRSRSLHPPQPFTLSPPLQFTLFTIPVHSLHPLSVKALSNPSVTALSTLLPRYLSHPPVYLSPSVRVHLLPHPLFHYSSYPSVQLSPTPSPLRSLSLPTPLTVPFLLIPHCLHFCLRPPVHPLPPSRSRFSPPLPFPLSHTLFLLSTLDVYLSPPASVHCSHPSVYMLSHPAPSPNSLTVPVHNFLYPPVNALSPSRSPALHPSVPLSTPHAVHLCSTLPSLSPPPLLFTSLTSPVHGSSPPLPLRALLPPPSLSLSPHHLVPSLSTPSVTALSTLRYFSHPSWDSLPRPSPFTLSSLSGSLSPPPRSRSLTFASPSLSPPPVHALSTPCALRFPTTTRSLLLTSLPFTDSLTALLSLSPPPPFSLHRSVPGSPHPLLFHWLLTLPFNTLCSPPSVHSSPTRHPFPFTSPHSSRSLSPTRIRLLSPHPSLRTLLGLSMRSPLLIPSDFSTPSFASLHSYPISTPPSS
ncbi:hypothetical protein C7M84_011170 [Penaeus vannamei]|uniref:Uncharacterized protein n=1 Tax=Penaeus vannamei TaxID=6689 RepID=A0A423T2C3_PENVA|nr:hypothetical protein C7M84_011170 [Penaeus vannamei]